MQCDYCTTFISDEKRKLFPIIAYNAIIVPQSSPKAQSPVRVTVNFQFVRKTNFFVFLP